MTSPNYTSKTVDINGLIDYDNTEHRTWQQLYQRQWAALTHSACEAFQAGVAKLNLSPTHIPQLQTVNQRLQSLTGWQAAPVPALISFKAFFELLAQRRFPCATFIRRPEELDYLKEPDIFHEVFGHCTLLTNPAFADFTQAIGEFGVSLSQQDRAILARLYWFTIEFGLLQTDQGLRIYGGGILSSIDETHYALHSDIPVRENFDLVNVLRTPYRYDEKQRSYFIIDDFESLFALTDPKILLPAFEQAKALGPLPNRHDKPSKESWTC